MAEHPRVLLALPYYRGTNHSLFLGIASLAPALKESGIEVAVIDEDVAGFAKNHGECSGADTVRRVVADFGPSLVGIHVNTPNYSSALHLAGMLSDYSGAPLVAGGPHTSAAASSILTHHPEFDFVLRGEADNSLPALAWALSGKGALEDIPGLSFRSESGIIHQKRDCLLDLATLPIPDRSVLLEPTDMVLKQYARTLYQQNFYATIPGFAGYEVAGAFVSRGCDAGCGFCFPSSFWAEPGTGKPVRRLRPVSTVLSELRKIQSLGFGSVFFDEPTFPIASAPAWISSFCSGIKELNLLWGAPTRLDELHPCLIPDLAESGLRYIYFGLETPHSHILKDMGKPADLVKVREIMQVCDANGVNCDVSLFFGAPFEDDDTIDATMEWMDCNLPKGNAFFSLAAYWPETPWAKKQGLSPEFWEPDFNRTEAENKGAIWYPENAVSIDRFYSNSTGTYHPAFLTIERALKIKERIISSGFRARFSRYARNTGARVVISP